MRLIPLLLCTLSGTTLAAGMPPLVVSPDLVRGGPVRGAPKPEAGAPAPAPDRPPAAADAAPSGASAAVPPVAPMAAPATSAATPRSDAAPAAAERSELAPGATEVRALRITGTREVELVAEGEAQLQQDDILLSADRLTYRELTDVAVAEGNVRLMQGDDLVTGPRAELKVQERVGEFESPRYFITRQREPVAGEQPREVSGSGGADVMYFEGENQYRLKNATWTTCEPDDPDWYIRARELELDYDRNVGVVRGGAVVFQDVPIFWWPWADFPLVGQRQSGFLAPTYGVSNKTGIDISVPYYWNIAPNYDATLAPRYMGRRGLQLAGEFRYLTPSYRGESHVEWLPSDNVTGEERALGSFQHQHWFSPTLYGSLDFNAVSDNEYFEDLSTRLSVASRVNLLRQAQLTYVGGEWWSASALLQSYQTLSGADPYRRLPQLALNANRPDLPWGANFLMQGEFVQFDHPDPNRAEGARFIAYPQIALPFVRAGYYVTPKIGMHYTRYQLERPLPGGREEITRSLPIFTVDSGLAFERDARIFGRNYLQTLEPRIYYVHIPFERQNDIPLFDTARYDFGFAQIFSENLYAGGDRIADANQVTAAVTSRLIDPESGGERMRATIGQRYYFEDQRVTLNQLGQAPVETPRTGRRADVLAAFGGRLTRAISLDSAWQYNPRDRWTERLNFSVRYQPDYAKALNLSYRYAREAVLADATTGTLRDLDLSGQWPLGGRWYGVGRVTRSLEDDRITEALAGLEYNGGCWVLRTVLHRFATNPEDVTQALFVQLELNGLASVGSSPLNLLKRSVPGYGKINEPTGEAVFGAY